jgi:hypothetical protein
MTFDRVAFVWGENVSGDGPLTRSPSVSVALWPEVLGCASLRWCEGQMPDISGYDLFLVNLFHTADSTHIAQIRAAQPEAVIVAMPDAPVDQVLSTPEWIEMFRQMALADLIGGRTVYDCQVYGTLLHKPVAWLPSPIGPTEWYLPFRELPKEDYIVAQDHGWTCAMSAHNVAALAAIQRQTGLRVVYAQAFDYTKAYARLAGLEAEFHDHIRFGEFVDLTARARLSVDLYARHSYHRHAVLCAMVGTPVVASAWTHPDECAVVPADPFEIEAAVDLALDMLAHPAIFRRAGYAAAERFSFEASRCRVEQLMERVR